MPPAVKAEPARSGFFTQCAWGLLLLYIILYFARPFDTYGFGFDGMLRFVAFPMIGCWGLAMVLEGQRPDLRGRPIRWALGFMLLLVYSTAFGIVTMYGVGAIRYVAIYIFLPILIAATLVRDGRRLRIILICFGLVMSWLAIEGLRNYVFSGGGRWRGAFTGHFLNDPNDFALFMNCFFPLLVYFALHARRPMWRRLSWGLAGAALASSVFTFSRGGFITLACMACYLLYRARGARGRVIFAGAVGGLVLAMVLPASYWAGLAGAIPSFGVRGGLEFEDASAEGRYEAWHAGWLMLKDRPLTGVGPLNFASAMWIQYRPPGVRYDRAAHSVYVETMGEHGIPGLVWLVGLIVVNLRALRNAREIAIAHNDRDALHRGMALELGLIAFLVGGAFLSVLYYPHLYWLSWFISVHARETATEAAPVAAPPPVRMRYGLARS